MHCTRQQTDGTELNEQGMELNFSKTNLEDPGHSNDAFSADDDTRNAYLRDSPSLHRRSHHRDDDNLNGSRKYREAKARGAANYNMEMDQPERRRPTRHSPELNGLRKTLNNIPPSAAEQARLASQETLSMESPDVKEAEAAYVIYPQEEAREIPTVHASYLPMHSPPVARDGEHVAPPPPHHQGARYSEGAGTLPGDGAAVIQLGEDPRQRGARRGSTQSGASSVVTGLHDSVRGNVVTIKF